MVRWRGRVHALFWFESCLHTDETPFRVTGAAPAAGKGAAGFAGAAAVARRPRVRAHAAEDAAGRLQLVLRGPVR